MWHFHRHVPAVSDYDCSDSAPWTPYCWSCGSSSVNVNSVRPPAVKEPEPSSLSFYFVVLFGPCTTTFQWLINNAWAAGLCSVVYADILLEQFEPFDCYVVYKCVCPKAAASCLSEVKGVKGFKDRFVPPLQTFPVSPVSPDMTVVLSWSGFFCDSTDKMKGILRRMNKSPLVWDQLIHHNVMIRVCGRFTQRGDATLQRPWMLLLIKSHLDGWRG